MQVLMSDTARARLGSRLDRFAPGMDVVTLDVDGALTSSGETLASAAPEAAWLSRDLHRTTLSAVMADYILQSPSIRWVQSFRAGVDDAIFRQMMTRGVRVTKSNAQAPAIADYVLAHVLSLIHPIEEQIRLQQVRQWKRVPFREISSTHVVLVGFGAIGAQIAQRLAPFQPRVTVVRRSPQLSSAGLETKPLSDLLSLLPDADVVVLACALNEETRKLADGAFFAAMKPGSIFVNIARGALVDEAALRAGLERGRPGFAVLDVFETEPLPPRSWLWDHPQVRVTAHCANDGDRVTARGDDLFLENLRRYARGEDLLNEVAPAEVGL